MWARPATIPSATSWSHILGYVASVSPQDMEHDDDPLLSLPGFRIGKRGIEKAFDSEVRGRAGASPRRGQCLWPRHPRAGQGSRRAGRGCLSHHRRRGAAFRRPASGRRKRGLRGDGRDQWRCPRACPPRPASIPTGSMSASPAAQWHDLTTDDHKPLLNKAIAGIYPPGSTFKTAVALAAVEAGMATPTIASIAPARSASATTLSIAMRGASAAMAMSTWHGGIQVSLRRLLLRSGAAAGHRQDRGSGAASLGLGAPTGIELPGEQAGLIPTRAWKMKTISALPGSRAIRSAPASARAMSPRRRCSSAQQAARIASGKAVVAARCRIRSATRSSRRPTPAPLRFLRRGIRHGAPGHEQGRSMSRAARPMPRASPSRASKWRARPARRRCALSPRKSGMAA